MLTDIKEYKQLKTQNHLNSKAMKTSTINFRSKTAKFTKETFKLNFLKFKSMKNLLLTIVMLTITLITNPQSIQSQAEKAGNDAFANAMIRNIFIIIGVVVFFAISGSKKSKDDKKM